MQALHFILVKGDDREVWFSVFQFKSWTRRASPLKLRKAGSSSSSSSKLGTENDIEIVICCFYPLNSESLLTFDSFPKWWNVFSVYALIRYFLIVANYWTAVSCVLLPHFVFFIIFVRIRVTHQHLQSTLCRKVSLCHFDFSK